MFDYSDYSPITVMRKYILIQYIVIGMIAKIYNNLCTINIKYLKGNVAKRFNKFKYRLSYGRGAVS